MYTYSVQHVAFVAHGSVVPCVNETLCATQQYQHIVPFNPLDVSGEQREASSGEEEEKGTTSTEDTRYYRQRQDGIREVRCSDILWCVCIGAYCLLRSPANRQKFVYRGYRAVNVMPDGCSSLGCLIVMVA